MFELEMEEKMEQHPRKSRAKLAAYIVCFVLSVLCATILLVAAALLFYYTSLLAHIWSSSNIPAFSQNIVQNTSTADTHSFTKPNIVIILADDLVNLWEYHEYQNSYVQYHDWTALITQLLHWKWRKNTGSCRDGTMWVFMDTRKFPHQILTDWLVRE